MVNALRAGYAEIVDMMYVTCRDGVDLSLACSIEDTPSGITVMYGDSGEVIGAEISDFSDKFGIPASINVDAKVPFVLNIDESALAEA